MATSSSTGRLLACLALVWLGSALTVGLLVPSQGSGDVVRIAYVMVPTGWIAGLALVGVFLCSAAYLGTEMAQWDRLAHAAAELALVFALIAAVQGLFLVRASTGEWWTMDARVMGYGLVALIAGGCLVPRLVSPSPGKAPKLAATVGCGAFLVAGVSRAWIEGLVSVRLLDETRIEAAPVVATQWLCGLAMGAVFLWLLAQRVDSLPESPGVEGVV